MMENTIPYFDGCPSGKIALGNVRQAIDLLETFQQTIEQLENGIVKTVLPHSTKGTGQRQVITVWEGRGVLYSARVNGAGGNGVKETIRRANRKWTNN